MISVGGADGTRAYAVAGMDVDGANPADTDSASDADAALMTLSTTDTQDGEGDDGGAITDGWRLSWVADPPPAAYLINALLVGGTGVSNCYVGNAATPATIDTATPVSAPGFQPDVVIVWGIGSPTNHTPSIGFVVRDGSDTQRAIGQRSNNGGTAQVSSTLSTDRVSQDGSVSFAGVSISNFSSTGFDLFLRDVNGSARTVGYMAIKLSGISAKVLTCASPTATGDHTCTGAGFTPQAGLILNTDYTAVDTYYTSGDGEVFGLGAFTASSSASSAIWSNDNGSNPNDTASMTDTKPINTYKNTAAHMIATFSAFTSDGVTFNYSTADTGGARQRGLLLFQASTSSSAFGPTRRRVQ
jgi:hypothetical protein